MNNGHEVNDLQTHWKFMFFYRFYFLYYMFF